MEKSEKTIIFNSVVWVGVWFWAKLVRKVLIARFSQSRDSANRAIQRQILMHRPYPLPLEKSEKTVMFNPVVWVGVWFWVNGTCLLPGPLSYLPRHIFKFFVSCTGPEEIVPVCTRGKRRKKNTNQKKNKTGKKKKSREI